MSNIYKVNTAFYNAISICQDIAKQLAMLQVPKQPEAMLFLLENIILIKQVKVA